MNKAALNVYQQFIKYGHQRDVVDFYAKTP